MTSETDSITPDHPLNDVIDPNSFDITVNALLISVGAEKYIETFRNHNIGQCTLMELTDEDLIKFGVDDKNIRTKLIEEVQNLPIYAEIIKSNSINPNLGPMEIIEVLEESSQHLYRIYLSMMTNTLALKKANPMDLLIYNDKYASNVALITCSHMTNILNSMDIALHTQIKVISKGAKDRKTKKVIVGAVGGVAIAILAVFFVQSLKQLQ